MDSFSSIKLESQGRKKYSFMCFKFAECLIWNIEKIKTVDNKYRKIRSSIE